MIEFIKVRDVKDPIRNPNENAGIDMFIPDDTTEFRQDLITKNPDLCLKRSVAKENGKSYMTEDGEIYVAPHKDIIIPSGIKSKFDKNLALIANNKSGVATKKKLIFGASVIDTSYQGEWHYHLINTSDDYQVVECGTKVIQFIPHYISMDPVVVRDCSEEEFFTEKTSRGAGWAGSTGIK